MFSTVDNRVQLIGFLGQEIEVKEIAEGKKMARFSLATSESRINEDGTKEKITTWHNLLAWGKTAEVMSKIFCKGQRLYIEGKLAYREYTTHDGVRKQSTDIVVSDFKKLEPYDRDSAIHHDPSKFPSKESDKPSVVEPDIILAPEEEDILIALKHWRSDKANTLNVPNFMICHNAELMTLAKMKPRTLEDLSKIKGFGDQKIARHGDEIISIILAFD